MAEGEKIVERKFSVEEKKGLVNYINSRLELNIETENDDLFERVKSGALLCNLIESMESGTLTGKINNEPKNQWEMNLNHEIMLEGAKKLGCSLVNIGPVDLTSGTKHLVLGVAWQLVRYGLLKKVKEISSSMLHIDSSIPPEEILLMWINYHLKKAGINRVVTNFGHDLSDSIVLILVMNQVAPDECSLDALDEPDSKARATMMLNNAEKIGCRKFVDVEDILCSNARMNLAFVAGLFYKYPEMLSSSTIKDLEQQKIELSSQLEEKETQNKNLSEKNSQIALDLQTTKEELEKMKSESVSNSEQLKNVTESLNLERAEKQKIETEFENFKSEASTLKLSLDNEVNAKVKALEDLEKTVEELNNHIKQITEMNKQLEAEKAEKESLNKEVESVKSNLQRVEEEKTTVSNKLSQVESKLTEVSDQLAHSETEKANLSSHITQLESEKSDLSTQLTKTVEDRNNLSNRVEQLESEKSNITTQLTKSEEDKVNLSTQITQLESDKITLTTQLTKSEEDKVNLSTQITQLESDKTNLTTQLTKSEEDKVNLSTQITQLESDKTTLTTQLTKSEEDKVNLTTQITQLESDKTTLTTQLNKSEEDNTHLNTQLTKLNEEFDTLKKTNQSNIEEIQQKVQTIKVKEDENVALNDRIKELEDIIQELKKKIDELEKKIKSLESQLDEEKKNSSTLKKNLDEKTAELTTTKEQLKKLQDEHAQYLESLEAVTKQGWLQKLSPKGNKRLQKRWFILKGEILSYFKSDKDSSSKPLGTIDCIKSTFAILAPEEAKKKTGSSLSFEITTEEKVFTLVCSSENEMQTWFDAMTKAQKSWGLRSQIGK
eukprot:TRINITY_DN63_c2_g1_i2.p1 TRINITY_DN63_c2_g1~~TRINITY_DN63_c2_g1_i2.p1  ORF type:complete len:845 (+),score=273.11 TRINITY_DN63_c2_g1_i2:31-2535(+)